MYIRIYIPILNMIFLFIVQVLIYKKFKLLFLIGFELN